MKAQLNEMTTAIATTLHRKSTSAISRHRAHSHGKASAAATAVGVAAELAAAAAAAAVVASPSASNNTSEEMQAYFSKLKQLVPFMPRNRKLSKLEIIQYVIDYICDLQLALENGASVAGSPFHAAAAHTQAATAASTCDTTTTTTTIGLMQSTPTAGVATVRQPLGVIPNNNTSNGTPNANTCAVQEATLNTTSHHHHPLPHHHHHHHHHHHNPLHDKSPLVDSTVSC